MKLFHAGFRLLMPEGRLRPSRGRVLPGLLPRALFSVSVWDGARQQRRAGVRRARRPAHEPKSLNELDLRDACVSRRSASRSDWTDSSSLDAGIKRLRRTEKRGSGRNGQPNNERLPFDVASVPAAAAPMPGLTAQRAIHNIVADKGALSSYRIIRQSQGHPLTTATTKEEARELAKAERFFTHQGAFLYSAETLRNHPFNDHMPEMIVLGASNVGKSSFLNALTGRHDIARVSQRPGRTTAMNAYGVGPQPIVSRELMHKGSIRPKYSLVLVDTPGYGHKSQSFWGASVLEYLKKRRMLRGAVLLLSSEKGRPLSEDRWVLEMLAERNIRTLIVLTKADKGHGDWPRRCGEMVDAVFRELAALDAFVPGNWMATGAAAPHVHITAAGMECTGKLGNGGGMGGVRAAILEMAGFSLQGSVTKSAENTSYGGPVVPFDELQWR